MKPGDICLWTDQSGKHRYLPRVVIVRERTPVMPNMYPCNQEYMIPVIIEKIAGEDQFLFHGDDLQTATWAHQDSLTVIGHVK